jgi:hypothetical protein
MGKYSGDYRYLGNGGYVKLTEHLNVVWKNDAKRNRPTIETVISEQSLDVTSNNWRIKYLRDNTTRKSLFQPRSKTRVQEIWTDSDGVQCNPTQITSPIQNDGYFYLHLLGSDYKQSGMTSPYMRFYNLHTHVWHDIAKLSIHNDTLMVQELENSIYIPDLNYLRMYPFLVKPELSPIGYYAGDTIIGLDSVTDSIISTFLPSRKYVVSNLDGNQSYVIPQSNYIVRLNEENELIVLQRSMITKQYINDWLTYHPIATKLTRVRMEAYTGDKAQGKLKANHRLKDARDKKYKRRSKKA